METTRRRGKYRMPSQRIFPRAARKAKRTVTQACFRISKSDDVIGYTGRLKNYSTAPSFAEVTALAHLLLC